EDQPAVEGDSEAALPRAERRAGRGDRGGKEGEREDSRCGAVLIRVLRRLPRARLVRPPGVVAARDDPVQLIVALGAVLRLPEVPGERVEREAEAVPEPVRPDEAAGERVVGRCRSRP